MSDAPPDPAGAEPLELPAELARCLAGASSVVVFTGAGISSESGLATFRDSGGLWRRYRAQDLATPEAFARDPETVWEWYGERFRAAEAAGPNPAHRALVRLERLFPFYLLVTQNVDGLHQRAGSRDLVEVHGSLARARCHRCERRMPMPEALSLSTAADRLPPTCDCGGRFRPDVVWFGEPLPRAELERAFAAAAEADLVLSVGTSAQVWPAAGVVEVALSAGAALVEVNPEPTPFTELAALHLAHPAGEALPRLVDRIEEVRRGDDRLSHP